MSVGGLYPTRTHSMSCDVPHAYSFYALTQVLPREVRDAVKEQLQKISSVLQYVSFEALEKMLYSMKSLNLKKF